MTQQATVLILTSRTGGGHISLAQALCDQLSQEYHIEIVDPQPAFFHLHYRLVSRYALWLWAAEFHLTDTPAQALRAHRLFTQLVSAPLMELIQRLRPVLIITTYPFLTYEVTQVLKRLNLFIPFVMLFADPNGVHSSWLSERRASATFTPTQETYAQALKSGFLPEQTHLVGWPIRAQFHAPERSQGQLLKDLGLDPLRFTIFLQGGGEGAAKFSQTIERTLQISEHIQIILATGTNKSLYERFQHTPRLYPLAFTSEIAPYIAAADVIMGKAGPNILFEGTAMGKPFIASTYIPGQEEANLAFIQRHKLGWVALTSAEQHRLLTHLITDHEELFKMRESVVAYSHWNSEANRKIIPLIKSLLTEVSM